MSHCHIFSCILLTDSVESHCIEFIHSFEDNTCHLILGLLMKDQLNLYIYSDVSFTFIHSLDICWAPNTRQTLGQWTVKVNISL